MTMTQEDKGHVRVRIQALGGYRIVVDGRDLRLRTRKEALLLLRLALAGDEGVSRDECIGLLWPESSEARARHSLSEALRGIELATRLEIDRTPERVSLPAEAVSFDVRELEEAIARGDVHDCAEVYKGAFLAGWYPPTAEASHWVDGVAAGLAAKLERSLRSTLPTLQQATDGRGVVAAVQLLDRLGVAMDGDRAALAEAEQIIEWEELRAGETVPTQIPLDREGPFVGRAETMRLLTRELAWAMAGEVRVVLVSGESGIGKTRTCQRIARLAALRGARIFMSACYELEQTVPYGSLIEALAGSVTPSDLSDLKPSLRESLAVLLPEMGSMQEQLEKGRPEPQQTEARLLQAATTLIEVLCRRRCGMLLIDDFQWADSATCLLLHHALRRAEPDRGLLVVLGGRPITNESNAAAAALLRYLRPLNVQLGPLSPFETRAQLSGLRPGIAQPEAERIARLSQGNPLFVRELALADNYRSDELPRTVRDAVTARIGQLPSEEYHLLALLAVAGGRCRVEVLSRVLGGSTRSLLDAIAALTAQRLIREEAGEVCIYHDLVRSSIYSGVSDSTRQAFHGALARADSKMPPATRAHHFASAGLEEEATNAAFDAAADARDRFAQAERLSLLELALRTAQPSQRDAVLQEFAAACLEAGEYRRLLTATSSCSDDLRGPTRIRVELARLKRANLASFETARAATSTIIQLLAAAEAESAEDFVEIAREQLRYAHEGNDLAAVRQAILRLETFAEGRPGTSLAGHALVIAAYQQHFYAPGPEAERNLNEALRIGQSHHNLPLILRALLGFAMIASGAGDTAGVCRHARDARAIARRCGMVAEELKTHGLLAAVDADRMQFRRALRRTEAVVRRIDSVDQWNTAAICQLTAAGASLALGEAERAEIIAAGLIADEGGHPDRLVRINAHAMRGLALLALDRQAEAETHYEVVTDVVPELPQWMDDPQSVLELTTRCMALRGRIEDAIALAHSVAEGCQGRNTTGYWGASVIGSQLLRGQGDRIDESAIEEIRRRAAAVDNRLIAFRCAELLAGGGK